MEKTEEERRDMGKKRGNTSPYPEILVHNLESIALINPNKPFYILERELKRQDLAQYLIN
jgi:hypothetical protein